MAAPDPPRGVFHLVPMGNLATMMVPVAVIAGQLAWSGWVGGAGEGEVHPPIEPELALSVLLEPHGYVITTGQETVTLTCGGCAEPHDTEALKAQLRKVKNAHPQALTVVVVPERGSDYATLMRTVRAARRDEQGELFPQAIIAGTGE